MPPLRLALIALLPGLAAAQATNVALNGTATQSSTRPGGGAADRAIDGNTDGNFPNNSVTHTDSASTLPTWWEVKLPNPETVHEIRIWNRGDCCTPQRLANFTVTAFLGAAPMFTMTQVPPVLYGNYLSLDMGAGIICDRVRIDMLGAPGRVLSLAEVELLNWDKPVLNMARLGVATQSTTAFGGEASRAIDGNYNRNWGLGNSTSHTANQSPSWWQVQLPLADRIDEIRLYNRGDCCSNRLSNFRVSVFLGPTEVFGQDAFVNAGSVGSGMVHTVRPPAGTVGDRVRVETLGLGRSGEAVIALSEVEVLRIGASLTPDTVQVKFGAGNKQKLELDGGRKLAGQTYLLLGSVTGTSPGITFGNVNTPLNFDLYFQWTLENPTLPPLTNSQGKLDVAGRSSAEFTIPPGTPNLIGLKLYHAFAVLGRTQFLDAASNATLVEIVQ